MKRKKDVPTADVLSHFLVSDMKILSGGERSKLLAKFGISDEQLPRMCFKDPAVFALKAAVGDIVKIERDDGTGKYTTYRVVVE
ncbi:MAG: DNA-directed RNA polymerase subunit RpoH/Rpb5 C-terminal domain-containing protein [Candidatus Micrarchaeota archaeon]